MELLEWLRAGSEDHTAKDGNGANFEIVPKSDSDGDRRAFQSAAHEAIANSGAGFTAVPHKTSEWGLKDWSGPVYDFVAILPTK